MVDLFRTSIQNENLLKNEDLCPHLGDIAQRGTLDLWVWFGATRSETFGLARTTIEDDDVSRKFTPHGRFQ